MLELERIFHVVSNSFILGHSSFFLKKNFADENVSSLHTVNNMSLCERIFIINELVQFALPFDFD